MTSRPLTVAISSRALFDLDESNRVYEEKGLAAYRDYQIEREDQPLEQGDGFSFVQKLLNINKLLEKQGQPPGVEVILLSRNSADTGLRIFNSIRAHGLDITRAAFSGGATPYRYVAPFGCDLFLSMAANDVAEALSNGAAAATLFGRPPRPEQDSEVLRIAFDGDAVLFSDAAQQVFETEGVERFGEVEAAAADEPLAGGPFKPFLAGLHDLQRRLPDNECPIRTALVTARGAPADERVIKTLRAWNIRLDESLFLGGRDKGEFLRAFGADVFFDDAPENCASASSHTVAGHVPRGVVDAASQPPAGGADSQ